MMNLPTFTVLMVEDLAADRELYRRAFDRESSCVYDLLEAESVAAALVLCQTRSIDAVLLDYLLPDGNGLDFLERLAVQTNSSQPPVVMISGQGDERVAVRAIKLGAEDYLVKSELTAELLLATLRSAIDNTRLRSQLQQQEERFRASVENMLDCFGIQSAIRDSEGQIVDFRFDYLNAAAMRSNRMTEADMGKTVCEVFPAFRQGLLEQCARVVETGIPLVREDLVYTDVFGGEQLTIAYSVHLNKLGDGYVAAWRDITAQKQAELNLRSANQQITTIWESMTDAYATLDRDWRVVYTNPAAVEVFRQTTGLTPAEYLGRSHWELFPATVGTIVEQEYHRAVAEGVAVHFELFYEPTETWFEVHAYPSDVGLGVYFRDINQRKRTELARIAAEREIDRFFNLSIDLLVVANLDGYFIRVNPACEQILGFTSAEMMAKPFIDFVHPDDLAATIAIVESLSAGNVLVNFENRYRCEDGSYRWILWSAILDPDRSLIYANGHDITDRKQAETDLQIGEELFRSTFENTSVGMAHVAIEGTWIRVNHKLCEILGYSSAELLATTYQAITAPADADEDVAVVEKLLNGEINECTLEKRYIHKHGHYVWTNLTVTPICTIATDGQLGIPQYFIAVIQDITERKLQSAALLQSERKFSAIFNQTFQLMGLVSLDGVLLKVNQAALDSIAAPESEVVGKSFWEAPWWHTEQLQQQLKAAIATAASGQFVRYEVEFPNPNGGVIITDFSLKPMFNEVGRVESIVAEAHDITDRKQAQADLEERNRELDSFVYVVSHDLKAPLRAVANLSQWIEDDLDGQLTADTQSQMALLRSRVNRMAATIDGLLEYARCGRSEDKIETVAVARLLADVIDSLAPPPTFTIDLPTELPTLITKRSPLFQVFVNLIGNGIKHHHSEAGTIGIAIATLGDFYEFAVSDDGSGIAPEHHDRMFKIFQAVNPQKRSDSTGIGLAIVKKTIEAEGGTIRLESELGRGTTFYFTWPKRSV